MQRDSVIALQPTLGIWRGLRDLTGADPDAVYGCVDWYLYHEPTLTECAARSSRDETVAVIDPGAPKGATAASNTILPSG